MAGLRVRLALMLSAAAWLLPSPAWAAWSDLAPRPFENGGSVEVFGSYERDSQGSGDQPFRWNDTFFREKVTLFSNGYFYHPRFMQYQFSVAGALKQENFSPNYATSTGWNNRPGLEYTGRLFLLPEHPYNLELFALRYEPLYKEQSATQYSSVETSNGLQFRYRKKPFFCHAGYIDNTTNSATSSSEVRRLSLDGEYFKRFLNGNEVSAAAFYNPSWFTGDLGLEGNSDQYGVNGLLNLRRVRYNLLASKDLYDQRNDSGERIVSDQSSLQNRLSVYLPLRFRADFYSRIQENQSATTGRGNSQLRELSDNSNDLQAILSHRLYESLDSRYMFLRTDRTSSGGESISISNSLGADYSKLIPRGRFMAGANVSVSQTENRGQADVSSEPHPATPVPGTFRLGQQNVERSSLDLFLQSPLPPFERIRLVENLHYTVSAVANTLEIQIFVLPPQFVVPGTYDLFASYSLTTGFFELQTDTYGFNTNVQLFDNMLTPYYSYIAVRSDVVAGVFLGIPEDSTTNTFGATFQQGPWRALGEYQILDWSVSPSRTWREEVQYIESVDPTLRVYVTFSYLDRYYSQGTSPNAAAAYADRRATLTGSVQKEFLSRSLILSAGGSYSHQFGLVDSDAYSLNSAVTWKIGKLDLSAGLDAYGSTSRGTTAVDYERDHQYIFFKVIRRFF